MLESILAHYQLFVLLLLALLLVVGAYVAACLSNLDSNVAALAQQLSATHQSSRLIAQALENVQKQVDQLAGENSDIHALAAHFVGYRRTSRDVAAAYYYDEENGCGVSPEAKFYDELRASKS